MKKVYFITLFNSDLIKLAVIFTVCLVFTFINIDYFLFYGREIGLSTNNGKAKSLIFETPKDEGILAIVIDDLGHSREGVDTLMSLRKHITFAVAPFMSNSQSDAEAAHNSGFEVMIHLPVKTVQDTSHYSTASIMLPTMNSREIQRITMDSFETIPYSKGFSIHAEKKLKNMNLVLSSIFDILSLDGSYFLDDKILDSENVDILATRKNIPFYKTDLVLDGNKGLEYVKNQLEYASTISLKSDYFIVTGTVGNTGGNIIAEAIKDMLPYFDKKNIKLVYMSELADNLDLR